jgi:Undecaprenyl-phosphate glucose phosphotransferase
LTRYSQYIKFFNIAGDVLLLNSAYIIAFYYKFGEFHPPFLSMLLYINIVWWLVSSITKPYKLARTSKLHQVLRASYTVLVFHVLLVFAYYVFEQSQRYSRELLLVMYSILFISFFIWKIAFIIFLRWLRKKGYNYRNIILVSNSDNPTQIQTYIDAHPEDGYRVKKIFEPKNYNGTEFHEEIKDYCNNNQVHEIFYTMSSIHHNSLVDLMNFMEEKFIKMRLIADFRSIMFRTLELEHFDLIPILKVVSTPLDAWHNQIIKRVFDFFFSLVVILFILTWLFPILFILIKLDSKGPIFFKQKRTGRDNKSFWCYKLRTMYVNDHSDTVQATKNDKRITKIGNFLRDSSLDELPQFFNVIKGEMSVVGPRPHMLKHTQDFAEELETFMVRHKIKPGITGLAQTKGYRGETEDFEKRKNRVKMDLFYIKNWSFSFDLAIIVNTVLDIFRGSND